MLETLFLSYANNSLIQSPENLHKIFHEIFLSVDSGLESGDCNSDFWLDSKDGVGEWGYAEILVDSVIEFGTINDAERIKEFFDHVKGAFIGAIRCVKSRFQAADHGSILLDEIGDISPRIKLKLLSVLEQKEFERVGESVPIRVDMGRRPIETIELR